MLSKKPNKQQANSWQKAVSHKVREIGMPTLLLASTTIAAGTGSVGFLGAAAIKHFGLDFSSSPETNNPISFRIPSRAKQPKLNSYHRTLLRSNGGQTVKITKDMGPKERARAVKGNIVKIAFEVAKEIGFLKLNMDHMLDLSGRESSHDPFSAPKATQTISKTTDGIKKSTRITNPSRNPLGLFQHVKKFALFTQGYTKKQPVDISSLLGRAKRQRNAINIHEERPLSKAEINKFDKEYLTAMKIDGTINYVGKEIDGVTVTKEGLLNATRAVDYDALKAHLKSNGKTSAFRYDWTGKDKIRSAKDYGENSDLQIKVQVKLDKQLYTQMVKDGLIKKYVGKEV